MREADDLSEVEVAARAQLWNRRLSRAFAASVICSGDRPAVGVAANHITAGQAAPLSAVAAAALSLAAARRLVLQPALARATRRSG